MAMREGVWLVESKLRDSLESWQIDWHLGVFSSRARAAEKSRADAVMFGLFRCRVVRSFPSNEGDDEP